MHVPPNDLAPNDLSPHYPTAVNVTAEPGRDASTPVGSRWMSAAADGRR